MQDHFSDELLLTFLDGELRPQQEVDAMAEHLNTCWHCRARIAEIEEQLHQCSRVFRDTDLAVGDSAQNVFERLQRRMPDAPPRTSEAATARIHRRSLRRVGLFFATGLAAIAAVSGIAWRSVEWRTTSTSPAAASFGLPEKPKAKLPPPEQVAAAPTARPPAAILSEPTPPPSAAVDLDEAEIDVRFQLHTLGLDVKNDFVWVSRSGGDLILRGLVANDAVRQKLKAALDGLPERTRIRLQIRTMDEAANTPRPALRSEQPIEVSSSAPPYAEQLTQLAGTRVLLVSKGNRAVAAAERLVDSAWALFRLEERYPLSQRSALTFREIGLLDSMDRDYLLAITDALQAVRNDLSFLLPPPIAAAAPVRLPQAADAAILKQRAIAVQEFVEWLFAGRSLRETPATFAAAQTELQNRLDNLDSIADLRLADLRPQGHPPSTR